MRLARFGGIARRGGKSILAQSANGVITHCHRSGSRHSGFARGDRRRFPAPPASGRFQPPVRPDAGGTAKYWGSNWDGQLGNGATNSTQSTPVELVGVSGATSLSAGLSDSCALMPGGTAECWGSGRSTPVDGVDISGATSFTSGWSHTCALTPGGTAKSWGDNQSGQLGDGTTTRLTPVDVRGLRGSVPEPDCSDLYFVGYVGPVRIRKTLRWNRSKHHQVARHTPGRQGWVDPLRPYTPHSNRRCTRMRRTLPR